MYTVGIKRKFLPFFKRYKVTYHDVASQTGAYGVLLTLVDGSTIYEVTRGLKLFPDFQKLLSAKEEETRRLEAARQQGAQEVQAHLAAQVAAQRNVGMQTSPMQAQVDTRLQALRAQQG